MNYRLHVQCLYNYNSVHSYFQEVFSALILLCLQYLKSFDRFLTHTWLRQSNWVVV